FQYAAVDNNGAVDTTPALASITITAANQAPSAFGESYSVNEGSNLVASHLVVDTAHGVLHNDFDPDNGPSPLSAQLISGPSHGALALSSDGSFSYTPDQYFVSYTSTSTPQTFTLNYDPTS